MSERDQWRVVKDTESYSLIEDGYGAILAEGMSAEDAERIVRDHNDLAAARATIERLRAYAMALRGDLVEVDGALADEDFDAADEAITRHMLGTLDEDVASLALGASAPAPDTGGAPDAP